MTISNEQARILMDYEQQKYSELDQRHGRISDMAVDSMADKRRGYLRANRNYFLYKSIGSADGMIEVPFFYKDGLVLSKSNHQPAQVLRALLGIERFGHVERCVATKKSALTHQSKTKTPR